MAREGRTSSWQRDIGIALIPALAAFGLSFLFVTLPTKQESERANARLSTEEARVQTAERAHDLEQEASKDLEIAARQSARLGLAEAKLLRASRLIRSGNDALLDEARPRYSAAIGDYQSARSIVVSSLPVTAAAEESVLPKPHREGKMVGGTATAQTKGAGADGRTGTTSTCPECLDVGSSAPPPPATQTQAATTTAPTTTTTTTPASQTTGP